MTNAVRVVGSVLGMLAISAASAGAEELLQEVSLVTDEGRALVVENNENQEARIPILTLDHPRITESRYALVGEIRYEGLEGTGYLEMWSVFEDGNRYFSRTLADRGPAQTLAGTSDWRTFVLPFFLDENKPDRPVALEMNVILPPLGGIDLRSVRLVQYEPHENPLEAGAGEWWNPSQAGILGAAAGAALGVLGAVVGFLASSGKGRGLVVGLLSGAILVGLLSLGFGLAAVVLHQPYAVTYPLLLVGGLAAVIPAAILPTVRRRYEAQELRKMEAMDRV